MSPRRLLLPLAASVLVAALLPVAAAPARARCAKKFEQAGCVLPHNARYSKTFRVPTGTQPYELFQNGPYSQVHGGVPLNCTGSDPTLAKPKFLPFPGQPQLRLPATMRIGHTYRVTWHVRPDYVLGIVATLTSASSAKLSLSANYTLGHYRCRGTATHVLPRAF